jgi:ribose transport system ATP-binding protein
MAPAPVPASDALVVRGASKTFGSQRVLSEVDLTVRAGEIRGLVGENGSGKSTLVKILAGYHVPDDGAEILVNGRQVATHRPDASEEAGLRFVHQDLALIDQLSAAENLGLGCGYSNRVGRPIAWSRRRREARAALMELGYDVDVDRPVAQLAASERTAVAVARALSEHRSPPLVLVLDEPTASLPGPEVERLFNLVRLVRDRGLAILFVSHHLSEVFDLGDSVTVMRAGRLVDTRPVEGLDEDTLIEMMVGRAVTRVPHQHSSVSDQLVLAAKDVAGGSVHGVDIEVTAGEIVGVAGVTGSGREAIAQLVFGGVARSGTVSVNGTSLRPRRPDLSMAAGVAFIPPDRNANASFRGHDVNENLSIARPGDFVRAGIRRRKLELVETRRWMDRLDVRPRAPREPLNNLSGGNAQKVILARWLRLDPKMLLLDEPTQGVDIGAREDIHRRIEQAAASGCAVVVCSTDSEELARLCTRVIVLRRGHVATELSAPLDADDITAACLADPRGSAQ